ncbi:MAG: adenylate/guanylate cyclase domain-containing protein [Chloroflexota bacterium]
MQAYTFLFTDIEGSTQLWEKHPQAMQAALERHDSLLRQAIQAAGGQVFKTVGDAFCAVFIDPAAALVSAIAAQRALGNEDWGETPVRVRIGLHYGPAQSRDADYFGPTLNRTARLMSAGHGGQILCSGALQNALGNHPMLTTGQVKLFDLGEHRLKDLIQPEHIFQVCAPGLAESFPPLHTLDSYYHNLPYQLNSFVGRQKELEDLKTRLRSQRLITLTGPGGTGKTRLALQAAAEVIDQFADGVCWVELAPLTDPGMVNQTVAKALGLQENPGRALLEQFSEYLRNKRLLLILDNCEHVLQNCAELADHLLRSCQHVQLLASSREPLGINGEAILRVPSLHVTVLGAVQGQTPTLAELAQVEAIRLFVDRASAVQSSFELNENNLRDVLRICQRLDGIPLAIELAAARVRSLTSAQLVERLDDRFRLLTGGSRTALPRQRTLAALIDWSYDLLSPGEQEAFYSLGVFSGGFTLEAAEAVIAGSNTPTVDLVDSLFNKSLLAADLNPAQARYYLLETIRQYAQEKLFASGRGEAIGSRHFDHFLALARQAAEGVNGPQQITWLKRIKAEYDNLRAALAWAAERQPHKGLELAAALWMFWDIHGYFVEGLNWLKEFIQRCKNLGAADAPDNAVRLRALLAAAFLSTRCTEMQSSEEYYTQAKSLAAALGARHSLAEMTEFAGLIAFMRGNLEQAAEHWKEGLSISQELHDELLTGQITGFIAYLAMQHGNHQQANKLYGQSLALFQNLQNPREIAGAFYNLAEVALLQKDHASALSYAAQSLGLYQDLEDAHGIATMQRVQAQALHQQGSPLEAMGLCNQSLQGFLKMGDRNCAAQVYLARGAASLALGQNQNAAEDFAQALELFRAAQDTMGVEKAQQFLNSVIMETNG